MSDFILAVDQGTTSTKAVVLDAEAKVVAVSGAFPVAAHRPRQGWVEYEPDELLESVRAAVRSVLRTSGLPARSLRGVGFANQGETVIAFHIASGKPVYRAISWMDRRTGELARTLGRRRRRIIESTGLFPDSYFSALKMRWIMDNVPQVREGAENGTVCLATSDVWLLNRLLVERPVCTDTATASRTMLLNLGRLEWDSGLTALLGIPETSLPDVVPNDSVIGHLNEEICGEPVPVCGACVDQQAALFGQSRFEQGEAKVTYGTGCFLLVNIGSRHTLRAGGLLTSVGWSIGGTPAYVLEGGVHNGGTIVGWLLDSLQIARSVREIDAALGSSSDQSSVFFIPALQGLAAPHWRPDATGGWLGLTVDTTKEHLLASALEAIAFRVREIVDAVRAAGCDIRRLRADGGLTNSCELMQAQSDVLGLPMEIFAGCEATACGVGLMAGIGCGLWKPDDLPPHTAVCRRVHPDPDRHPFRVQRYEKWRRLVERHLEECGHEST